MWLERFDSARAPVTRKPRATEPDEASTEAAPPKKAPLKKPSSAKKSPATPRSSSWVGPAALLDSRSRQVRSIDRGSVLPARMQATEASRGRHTRCNLLVMRPTLPFCSLMLLALSLTWLGCSAPGAGDEETTGDEIRTDPNASPVCGPVGRRPLQITAYQTVTPPKVGPSDQAYFATLGLKANGTFKAAFKQSVDADAEEAIGTYEILSEGCRATVTRAPSRGGVLNDERPTIVSGGPGTSDRSIALSFALPSRTEPYRVTLLTRPRGGGFLDVFASDSPVLRFGIFVMRESSTER